MSKSWNINYDIDMLNAFYSKYGHIAVKIFHMPRVF